VEEVIQDPSDNVVLTEDVDCSRMNRELDQLQSLRGQLTEKGELTSDIALEHQALTGSESLVNVYFSQMNRQKKYQYASEGLLEQTKSLLKKAKDLLWSMIVKVFNWFQKLFLEKKPLTEAAVEREAAKFKEYVGPVQRAERVPSSRTAIIAAVRETGLDHKFVSQLTPEEMDIYNEGPFHYAMQELIPTLQGFDVYDVVQGLENWHKKTLVEALNFDRENAQLAPELIERRIEQFKKDAQRTLDSATQMSRKIMDVRLEAFQKAQEARRKLKADPHFHLGTDLSGIMARGVRIFEQCGYKQMGNNMVEVHKGLTKTVQHLQQLRQNAEQDQINNGGVSVPGQQRIAEEWVEAAFMKEVNRIISTLHQCVQSVQLLNNYFSFVIAGNRTILQYVLEVSTAAMKFGGDVHSLNEIGNTAIQNQTAQQAAQTTNGLGGFYDQKIGDGS
jgi:hypothetical protein